MFGWRLFWAMSVIVFPDEINIWISSLSNQKSLRPVSEPNPTSEGLNRKKGWARGDSLSAWKSSSWDIVFYHLWAQTPTGTYTTGCPCSQSFGLKIMGLLSLHSYVSQFLKTNTMHQINISCGFCFSGEPWLMLVMPFPVHVWCLSSVAQSCPTLCDP